MEQAFGYCRKSTAGQDHTFHAQEEAIRAFCDREGIELLGVATEVASGGDTNRPVLNALIHQARTGRASIVVMKLDRLSRDVHHITGLMKSGIPFVTCEFGKDVDPFMLHIWASVAEQQRHYISERTRIGLKSAASKGVQLGNPQWEKTIDKAWSANRSKADLFAQEMMPIIEEIQSTGVQSYTGISKALNLRGIRTATGKSWYPATVRNIINRPTQEEAHHARK